VEKEEVAKEGPNEAHGENEGGEKSKFWGREKYSVRGKKKTIWGILPVGGRGKGVTEKGLMKRVLDGGMGGLRGFD